MPVLSQAVCEPGAEQPLVRSLPVEAYKSIRTGLTEHIGETGEAFDDVVLSFCFTLGTLHWS